MRNRGGGGSGEERGREAERQREGEGEGESESEEGQEREEEVGEGEGKEEREREKGAQGQGRSCRRSTRDYSLGGREYSDENFSFVLGVYAMSGVKWFALLSDLLSCWLVEEQIRSSDPHI
eukprot:764695-Hanusia_phi.AAC.2